MYTIKRFFALTLAAVLISGIAMAQDAVFSEVPVQNVNIQPVSNTSVEAKVVDTVNTQTATESLSNEKFKSAVNNLESAQVDVREQLATYKTLVADKEVEVANQKAELAKLKKEYNALQKKMNNIEKMKKMLNENIAQ